MPELPRDVIGKARRAHLGDRLAARCDDQVLTGELALRGLKLEAAFGLRDCTDRGVQGQLRPGLGQAVRQHLNNLRGLPVAKELAQRFLVPRDACLIDQLDEIPLAETGEGRFVEMRVLPHEVLRLGIHVGEIAAPAAGNPDLLAGFLGVVDDQRGAPPWPQRGRQTTPPRLHQ